MESPRFCEQCGTPLNPGARFCGQCGHAVRSLATQPFPPEATATPAAVAPVTPTPTVAPAPAPAVAPALAGESVLGAVAGLQRRKGMFGVETWTLVVTDRRLIFAELTQKMMNEAVRQAQQKAKQQGKGLLAQMAAQMGWMGDVMERYEGMAPEESLGEGPNNFFIPNSAVQRAWVERHVEHQRDVDKTTYNLRIESNAGKYAFELKGVEPGDAQAVLQRALGAVVR